MGVAIYKRSFAKVEITSDSRMVSVQQSIANRLDGKQVEPQIRTTMTDFDFMRRRRTSVRLASKLPGPRLKEASDASDERGHIGEIIFVGFDDLPRCVSVAYAGGKCELYGRGKSVLVSARKLWELVEAVGKADI